ncbi:MAG: xylose isomerase, partial [Saprospiraceae bacterium]|nr:xylose isomerase [Saprospiraceae bacterium]
TDQFPMHLNDLTEAMLVLLQAGGLQGGGINFDAKTRRNSTDLEDLFHAHIGGIDAFARALRIADRILRESEYLAWRQERYASFDDGAGAAFERGEHTLTDLYQYATSQGEPVQKSGKQEWLERLINRYL